MRTQTTRSASDKMAFLAITALGLSMLAACEPITQPVFDGPRPDLYADVMTRVSTAFAEAGEEVVIEILVEDGVTMLHADVRWDADLFEYSHALLDDGLIEISGDPDVGWMTIESAVWSHRVDGSVALVFVALADAATSGFATEATAIPDDGLNGERDSIEN